MSAPAVALTIQLASCLYLTGLIAVIQRLSYPAFAHIERSRFAEFHRAHTIEMAFLAGPAMVADLGSALWLAQTGSNLWLLNALAAGLTWILTFFVAVPLHNRLARGFDEGAARGLVRANWLRTALWAGRSLMLVLMLPSWLVGR